MHQYLDAKFIENNPVPSAFASAMGDLATRLDRLDELTQKGVHAGVSVDEMEFGLAQTCLLVGEMMRVGPEPTL